MSAIGRSTAREPRFVQLRGGVLDEWCQQHEISRTDRELLVHLLLEADWEDGVVRGFSLTRCAAELQLGKASGRRTLGERLSRLQAAGAITYDPCRSRSAGRVTVLVYDDLVKPGRGVRPDLAPLLAARSTRGEKGPGARSARAGVGATARSARGEGRESLALPGVLPPEDVAREDVELASSSSGSREGRSTDADVDEALAPLVAYARRCTPPVPTVLDAGGRRWLSTRTPTELAHAAAQVLARMRAGQPVRSPIGLLVALARSGEEDIFQPPAPATPLVAPPAPPVVEQPGPTSWSFPKDLIGAARQQLVRPATS